MYGHVARLASSIRAGVERAGCNCRVFQVAETLSDEVLTKMHAPPKNRDIPIIRPDQLPEADGFLFGMPTRFGTAPTQIKTLFDACGAHWLSDALIGKPVNFLRLLLIILYLLCKI
jgi:NAD(P)H dehydrogenase (quinone)